VVSLSPDAREALDQRARDQELQQLRGDLQHAQLREDEARQAKEKAKEASAPGHLSEEEQQSVDALKARDREVRAHEQAHVAAAGGYAGTPSYDTQQGPDGRAYAIGGHVSIDTSPASTPEATIAKMRAVKAAATAAGEPSLADGRVAAKAAAQLAQARAANAYSAVAQATASGDLPQISTLNGSEAADA